MENFLKETSTYSEEEKQYLEDLIKKLAPIRGEEYLKAGLSKAEILIPIKLDIDTICASILLSYKRDNLILDEDFLDYQNAINLAKSVIKMESIDFSDQTQEAENIRSMLVAIAKDIRVMIVKLAEILYLARHAKDMPPEDAKILYKQISEIYEPIASRLGLSFIKSELADLSLAFNKPVQYKRLLKDLANEAKERAQLIETTKTELEALLVELGIEGEVYGRVKHISSIYKKLQEKDKTLSTIFDLCAVRVVVKTKNECYAVLGAVHTKYNALDNRFKDYIARPKQNGYQSLHTTVLTGVEPLEIQIRTEEMHQHAEYGIAAHWLYKEHKTKTTSLDEKLMWIKKLLENPDDITASDLLDELKTDVYSGQIFVQSPMKKIIQLPENSTPIDFAYAIHSAIGNKCVGAKVNGKMVPITTALNNGDIVEIITNQSAKGPSRDWLKSCKSQNAKNKINAFFKQEMKDDNIKKGKVILEQAAKQKGITLSELLDEKWLQDFFDKYSLKNGLDDMYASVGYGSLTSNQVISKLLAYYRENAEISSEFKPKIIIVDNKKSNGQIEGFEDMLIKFAKCCNPIPGDEIVGFVSRGRGITIHRKDCVCLDQLEKDRQMDVEWSTNTKEQSYVASIKIIVNNKPGMLASISNKLAEGKINIVSISSEFTKQDEAIINLQVTITSKENLADLLNKLKSVSGVIEVFRK